ncbi:MAG: T9SS type A sorting domain-containing protein [Muribaculaceae bacterium]|nr:T9SS type A sorting domain-containing protein [Muribaculaceae bacterium]
MKKLLILMALIISLSANAQLEVLSNGHINIGNATAENNLKSTLSIWPLEGSSSLSNMPYISFGRGFSASIGGDGDSGMLKFNAQRGFIFTAANVVDVFGYSDIARNFFFSYSVKAPAFLTSSDARLKRNVESSGDLYLGLKDVNAVAYNIVAPDSSDSTGIAVKASKANEELLDDRVRFGFIAQEIQKIYPNLVVADEDGMLSIDYTGFIPLLVDAYNSLSDKVKEQEETIAELIKMAGPVYKPASTDGLSIQKAVLRQNRPNPFNTVTSIECTVPNETATAFICIYDLQGQQVHRIDLKERGDVVSTIDASSLRPGMYIYTLVADGAEIDSKRMIITD